MATGKDNAQEQNISEVLEMLKRSYSESSESDAFTDASTVQNKNDVISDEDLKKQLKMQYSAEKEEHLEPIEDAYQIDDDFLAEAEDIEEDIEEDTEEDIEENIEEDIEEDTEEDIEEDTEEDIEEDTEEDIEEDIEEETEEETEEDIEKETEDIEEFDEASEIEYLAQLDEDDDAPLTAEEIELLRRFSEDELAKEEEEEIYDDITFDQLPISNEFQDAQLESIPIESISEEIDDDVTFDELPVSIEDQDQEDIVYTPLALEESDVDENNDDVPWEEEKGFELSDNEETAEEQEYESLTVYDAISNMETGEAVTDGEPEEIHEEIQSEVIEELLYEFSDEPEEKPKYKVSGAELSLLLQLGCDEEIFELASEEDIEDISLNESIDNIPDVEASLADEDENRQKETNERLGEKILSVYEDKRKARGGMLVRMMVTAILCGVLLIYDGLPLLGVHLPGIMDRKEFFLSYVLIGLQLLIIALIPSAKQLWRGAKRLFTRHPDSYSIIALLWVAVLAYDCVIATVKIGTPHVFHFLLALLALAAIAAECASITFEISTYRFFFGDMIDNASGDAIVDPDKREATYTLRRSEGKNSTAEKMYRGGLDPSQAIYYPATADLTAGYFNLTSAPHTKQYSSLYTILPSLVISVLVGIISLLLPAFEGEAYVAIGAMLIALFMTLPVTALLTVWLPFSAFNKRNIKSGFAFACEKSTENYCDCDMLIFKDMHVFEKCSPKSVNLAVYDATSNDILISCLDSIYSTIGGPLEDSFSMGEDRKILECRLKRIAKSGIEAVVGNNYSVLIGNEQFMSRYGISFPQVSFKNKGDEIFSLCVSINGRASARIIVKYKINEMFEMFAWRLKEDGIYCVLESFDPMISTELLAKLRDENAPPVSVVRLGIEDYENASLRRRESALVDAQDDQAGVIARRSRLNLVVAAVNANRMRLIRGRVNILSYALCAVGVLASVASVLLNWTENINQFYLLLFWLILGGAVVATVFLSLPQKDRFTLEAYRADVERKINNSKTNKNKNGKKQK